MTTRRTTGLRGCSVLFAAAVACGPGAPEETTGPAGTTSTTGTSTTTGASTTTPEPTTASATTADPTTGTHVATTDASTSTSTSTTDSSSSGDIDDTGVCMVDPKAGICSDSCDDWNDCCQCEGKKLTPMGATECTIAMGIVTAVCPWWVWNVRWDGEPLQQLDACGGSEPGWTQHPEDGDIIVTLCGDTCAAYLQGSFAELDLDMFCEVA